MNRIYLGFILLMSCTQILYSQHSVLVLGIAQDGGYPHIGCKKECCNLAWQNDSLKKMVVSLAITDSVSRQWWLMEATPDITSQLHLFDSLTHHHYPFLPAGIFITHAHIGHYTGLMELGREALNSNQIPVYCLPKMKTFLTENGPWSQLVKLNNITLHELKTDSLFSFGNLQIMAFLVPHRDEYSETAGFKFSIHHSKYLFIPDIDKWSKWNRNMMEEVMQVNTAFLDGTFYTENELPGRNIAEIPHPTINETMQLDWENYGKTTRSKVFFIHFNHTNPVMWNSTIQKELQLHYFNFAMQGHWY
ncbi:MAG: pyrroloquinoline quinone biosynthesis protein PqqB [Bacteroidetes bacterium]|nr:pyrroloquinoline quinone biosynthesis protein PqqB [Bacteroidota bacterium]